MQTVADKPSLSINAYVRRVQALSPTAAKADVRHVRIGYNRVPPRVFAARFEEWIDYWYQAVKRPDRFGSSHNIDPESVFRAWLEQIPVHLINAAPSRRVRSAHGAEFVVRRPRSRAEWRDTKLVSVALRRPITRHFPLWCGGTHQSFHCHTRYNRRIMRILGALSIQDHALVLWHFARKFGYGDVVTYRKVLAGVAGLPAIRDEIARIKRGIPTRAESDVALVEKVKEYLASANLYGSDGWTDFWQLARWFIVPEMPGIDDWNASLVLAGKRDVASLKRRENGRATRPLISAAKNGNTRTICRYILRNVSGNLPDIVYTRPRLAQWIAEIHASGNTMPLFWPKGEDGVSWRLIDIIDQIRDDDVSLPGQNGGNIVQRLRRRIEREHGISLEEYVLQRFGGNSAEGNAMAWYATVSAL